MLRLNLAQGIFKWIAVFLQCSKSFKIFLFLDVDDLLYDLDGDDGFEQWDILTLHVVSLKSEIEVLLLSSEVF